MKNVIPILLAVAALPLFGPVFAGLFGVIAGASLILLALHWARIGFLYVITGLLAWLAKPLEP